MVFGLSLFSIYVAPLIAIIAWLISVLRLRSWLLLGMTLAITAFILLATFNPIFVMIRNPYVMLLLMGLAIFNVLLLPYANQHDRRYLIMANAVILLMMAALHAWAIYLRQSESYFYEQSAYWDIAFPSLISLTSLSILIIALIIAINKDNGLRWALVVIALSIMLGLSLGWFLI